MQNLIYFGDCIAVLKELNQQHTEGFMKTTFSLQWNERIASKGLFD